MPIAQVQAQLSMVQRLQAEESLALIQAIQAGSPPTSRKQLNSQADIVRQLKRQAHAAERAIRPRTREERDLALAAVGIAVQRIPAQVDAGTGAGVQGP